eukprot:6195483-Pleurochrysis_carterae.AAC.4
MSHTEQNFTERNNFHQFSSIFHLRSFRRFSDLVQSSPDLNDTMSTDGTWSARGYVLYRTAMRSTLFSPPYNRRNEAKVYLAKRMAVE